MSYGGPIFQTLGLNASTNSNYSGNFSNTLGAVTGCPGPENSVLAAKGYPGEQIFSSYNTNMKGGGAALAYNFDHENSHLLNLGSKGTYMPVMSGLVLEKNPINMDSGKQLMYGGKKSKKSKTSKKSSHKLKKSKRGGKTMRKFKRGSKSVTRKNHKDFETHKTSKYYSRKLPGDKKRHRLLAPVFPYLGVGGKNNRSKRGGMNLNNTPFAQGYSLNPNVPSALASPMPIETYNNCQNNYNHFTGKSSAFPEVVTDLKQ